MARNSEEKEFRLRPRKPVRQRQNEPIARVAAFKAVIHYARTSRLRKPKSAPSVGHPAGPRCPRNQRCAIRVTYPNNSVRSQWRTHGRDVARESAAGDPHQAGFDRCDTGTEVDSRLNRWRSAGDERLWKMIISPEFGDRLDLTRLTRVTMDRIARDLKVEPERAVVAHFNTGHPHVHVALRGVRADGEPLHLPREFVKSGIRAFGEDLCTRQPDHRTDNDTTESERREIREKRFTSLDRLLVRRPAILVDRLGEHWSAPRDVQRAAQAQQRHLIATLSVLGETGPGEQVSPGPQVIAETSTPYFGLCNVLPTGNRQSRRLNSPG